MGSEDYMFLEPVKEMVKIHSSSSLHIIDNCGHVVNVEQPALFNNAVINYISAFN